MHHPGPRWRAGVAAFEQPGIEAHVDHYRKLYEQGKLQMGGPFLDARGGGMMVATEAITEADLAHFAALDPAVQDGLLTYEVRPWLLGMER
jgi:uncharacterized protein YciI